ncbi:19048_t:CDS:1 [Racocetra fulgida]|uniref:19048_t:CDS:1 n=1 Tax=Racocetra fulgida TaxID=60492 RepID=A0A9N9CAM6_9GLOM|nr:19048_t:CDS:1 [Racocetra fulgida]
MEDINTTELENNTDELYGLSDIEYVSTDEALDNLTSFSSIAPNESASNVDSHDTSTLSPVWSYFKKHNDIPHCLTCNEKFTKKFSTFTLRRYLKRKHGIKIRKLYQLKLQFEQPYPHSQSDQKERDFVY